MSQTEVHRPSLKHLNGTHWGPMIPELSFNSRKGVKQEARFKEGERDQLDSSWASMEVQYRAEAESQNGASRS